jgi:hypothetical protein
MFFDRGSDAGVFRFNITSNFSLGFTRLSIIDFSYVALKSIIQFSIHIT